MAIIRSLAKGNRDLKDKSSEADAEYQVFESKVGIKYVQLTTFGSDDRQDAGSPSQAIRFTAETAHVFIDVLLDAFPR